MKQRKPILPTLALGVTLIVGLAAKETAEAEVSVGTFDSRALAIAWAHSDAFEAELMQVRKEYERAKEQGDEARVAEIDEAMRNRQDVLHKQGFGVWPVNDILVHLEDELPRIAEAAGVDMIVCEWDVVYRDREVELVDVTRAMVEPFHPDAKTLRWVEEVMERAPVPLEELEKVGDH